MAAIVIAACGWAAPMASAQTGIGIGAINGPNPLPLHTAPRAGGSRCGTRTTRTPLRRLHHRRHNQRS